MLLSINLISSNVWTVFRVLFCLLCLLLTVHVSHRFKFLFFFSLQIKQNFFLGVPPKERPVFKATAKLLDFEKTISVWCAIVATLAVQSHEQEQRARECLSF